MSKSEAKCVGLGLACLICGLIFKYKFDEKMISSYKKGCVNLSFFYLSKKFQFCVNLVLFS